MLGANLAMSGVEPWIPGGEPLCPGGNPEVPRWEPQGAPVGTPGQIPPIPVGTRLVPPLPGGNPGYFTKLS